MAGLIDIGIARRQQERDLAAQQALSQQQQQAALPLLQQFAGIDRLAGPQRLGEQLAQIQETDPARLFQMQLQALPGLLANPLTAPTAQQALQQQMQQLMPQQAQAQMSPTLQKFMELQQLRQIDPQSAQEFEKLLFKPATQLNIASEKVLGNDAANWRNKAGQKPAATMTISEAVAGGFTPENPEERKAIQSAAEAAPIMSQMIEWGFGKETIEDGKTVKEDPLFPPAEQGILQRGLGGVSAYLQGVSGSDTRISLYRNAQSSMVTGLARLAGQVGTLTDRDVDTVAGLFPTPGLTPEPLAREQFKSIVTLLKGRGLDNEMLKGLGFPDWTFETVQQGGISLDTPLSPEEEAERQELKRRFGR